MLNRVAIRSVVAEGSEAEQHANLFRMRIVNQLADEVMTDVGMLGVVSPGDGKLARFEAASSPKDQHVCIIFGKAIDGLLPLGEANDRHSHERDIVTAQGEWLCCGRGNSLR